LVPNSAHRARARTRQGHTKRGDYSSVAIFDLVNQKEPQRFRPSRDRGCDQNVFIRRTIMASAIAQSNTKRCKEIARENRITVAAAADHLIELGWNAYQNQLRKISKNIDESTNRRVSA
jgi:hypothetical protein